MTKPDYSYRVNQPNWYALGVVRALADLRERYGDETAARALPAYLAAAPADTEETQP